MIVLPRAPDAFPGSFRTKRELVYAYVQHLIVTGQVNAGDPLRQDDLAARLSVSSTPVREALSQLEAEGIVRRKSHTSVVLVEPTPDEIWEIYLIRSRLEGLATELGVANLTPDDVAHLRQLQAGMRAAAADGRAGEIPVLNHEWHMLIYGAARAPALLGLIRNLWERFPSNVTITRPVRLPISLGQHDGLLAAIEGGDCVRAGQLMSEHVLSAGRAHARTAREDVGLEEPGVGRIEVQNGGEEWASD
jgi:DNA-binding GntR family transcriptional regulator